MVAEALLITSLGWVASPVIKILFDKAHHLLGTSIKKRKQKLEASVLPTLSLVIEKAEKSPNKDKLVDWLRRLKDAYYKAEEAIDLLEYENLEKQVKNARKTVKQKTENEKGTRTSLPLKSVAEPIKNASDKIQSGLSAFSTQRILKRSIDNLIQIAEEARVFLDLLEAHENSSGRETISEPPIRVFGREIDKENIVSLLTKKPINSEPEPSTRPAIPIVAITGRSGVGKTALAQYVYKHMDGQNDFVILVWVHTPRKFKASDVIKNMIEIIKAKEGTSNNYPFTSLEALSTELRRMLRSKKLLLVLDDFWGDTEAFVAQWESFIGCLSSCSPGSSILLTTQSKNVAEKANLSGVTEYYLKEIEEDQFLELFMHYAWRSKSHLQKEEFEKIGRKIVVKLKGDPGAAKLVGQQLSGKNRRYWEDVAEKDWLGDNMKARIWSYQQLPLNLQRCFAICCLFSKGKRFKRDLLINLWMAEGFITPIDKHERLEDIGENYLDELVSRFFIEKVEVGKEKVYQLHDLLHDLAERVQGDDFIRIDSTNSRDVSSHISDMLSRSENIRHILLPSSMINEELKEKIYLMKNIRTFWVEHVGGTVPINVLQEILKRLEKLRVLFLFDCVDDLPDSIGKLKHLRYLSINGYQPLKKIPDSICKLYHLQRLHLMNCESLPKDFCELISLRMFNASKETISHISHVGRLTSLQKLDHFVVRKECGYELQQLENLNQLRGKMYIAGLENVGSTEDAVKAHMKNKIYLEALTFEWNSDERDANDVAGLCTQHVELLEALQPQHNISDLTLKGFGGDKFPNWILSKNSLNRLILRRLNNLKEMSSLPPNLTYLEIEDLPQLSYFSEDDLLINSEISRQIMKSMIKCSQESEVGFTSFLVHLANIYGKKEECKLVLPSSLTTLKISTCNIASFALCICIKSLVSLSKLELSNIMAIISLPSKEVLCSLKNLQFLIIRKCSMLRSLGGIGALTSLTELELNDCITLNISNDSLPSSLERLELCDIPNVEVLLANSSLPVLRVLDVGNPGLNKLSVIIGSLSNVRVLHVGNLSCLERLNIVGWNGHLEGLNSLTALNILTVTESPEINLSSPLAKYASALPMAGFDNLSVLKLILSNETISSLQILVIFFLQGDSLDDEVLQSLTSLKLLHFARCNITHLPKNLKNLASLQYMALVDCPNLREFELEELPKNLHELQIENCPNLAEKFNKGGTYRPGFRKEVTIVTFPKGEIKTPFEAGQTDLLPIMDFIIPRWVNERQASGHGIVIGERRVQEGKSRKAEEVKGKSKGVMVDERKEIEEDEDEDLLDSNLFSVLGDEGPHEERRKSSKDVCSKEATSSKGVKVDAPLATTGHGEKGQKAKGVGPTSLGDEETHGEMTVEMVGASSKGVRSKEAVMQGVVVPSLVQPELRHNTRLKEKITGGHDAKGMTKTTEVKATSSTKMQSTVADATTGTTEEGNCF